ncbi:uncharacterized protein EAF02_003296 [Botrytis sinoallii]|uniref:uncharacterized protein n=1 Tax=Botrytis sinoallii TaxID=1463999 RepID=UPI0019008ECD|nr:uncharacterized protein EAF02_003296 [Botrytis sinoallii]KAF7886649.1 hypothetical protein EAF02_003296 [Botrytis sinoallii]
MTPSTAYKPVPGKMDPPKAPRPWVNRTIVSGSVAPILSSAGSASPPAIKCGASARETTKAFKIATGRRMRELYDDKYTREELVAEISKDSGIFAADSPAALSLTIRRYLRERYDGKGSNDEILAALAEDFLVFPKELGY